MSTEVAITRSSLPNWPRLMSRPLAAAYLSISETNLGNSGPAPARLGRRVLYDRMDLDRWADRLSGQPLTPIEELKESNEVERRFLEKRRMTGGAKDHG